MIQNGFQMPLTLIKPKKRLRLVYSRRHVGTFEDSPIDEDRCLILWWAVLERAIQDALGCTNFKRNSDNERIAIREAREWLELFTFSPLEVLEPEVATPKWICNLLDIDINTLRRELEEDILEGRRRRESRSDDKELHELIIFRAKKKQSS